MSDPIYLQLAQELGLELRQIERSALLLAEGNTIPFITRYRKEVTGGLDEEQLRRLAERLDYLHNLELRRTEVRALLEAAGHLSPELDQSLAAATTLQAIEDLYLPFRPKRRTRAQVARDRGLAPLAERLLSRQVGAQSPDEAAAPFLNEQLPTTEAALGGARDIIAEQISETAQVRQAVREATRRSASVYTSRKPETPDDQGTYQHYYEFREPLAALPPHRILAIDRGEREGVLRVDVEANHEAFMATLQRRYAPGSGWVDELIRDAIADGYKRLLAPAIERELRAELSARAEQHALTIFAANLRRLLLQPPLCGRVVLGIDPGYRTGCKLAVVDPTGKYLAGDLIYLHQPDRARETMLRLCQRWGVQVVAIGNGTASREAEAVAAALIHDRLPQLAYTMVSEAGASVYSASPIARDEFPTLDATERGTISIARRLQDPLAELVKIEPKALGIGMYQHDVDQKALAARLESVVESAVNYVGVDLNTASAALLTYVAGLNSRVAKALVTRRDAEGPFRSRADLKQVKGLGPKAFEQAAGFLRIPDAVDPLDRTAIHPESYGVARRLLARFGAPSEPVSMITPRIKTALGSGTPALSALAAELAVGEPTLTDIIEQLDRPGRDPRDELPPPLLRADLLKIEDLEAGMWLKGTVRNVVDFGAFVDIGLKQDGLVHVSELADRRVRNPLEVVQVGDQVDVQVLSIDLPRGRIALSMKKRPSGIQP